MASTTSTTVIPQVNTTSPILLAAELSDNGIIALVLIIFFIFINVTGIASSFAGLTFVAQLFYWSQVIDEKELWGGFSNKGVINVAAIAVIVHVLAQNRIIKKVAMFCFSGTRGNRTWQLTKMCVANYVLALALPNSSHIQFVVPLLTHVCLETGMNISYVLMPVAVITSIANAFLISTSSNLILGGLYRDEFDETLPFFEFAPQNIPASIVTMIFVIFLPKLFFNPEMERTQDSSALLGGGSSPRKANRRKSKSVGNDSNNDNNEEAEEMKDARQNTKENIDNESAKNEPTADDNKDEKKEEEKPQEAENPESPPKSLAKNPLNEKYRVLFQVFDNSKLIDIIRKKHLEKEQQRLRQMETASNRASSLSVGEDMSMNGKTISSNSIIPQTTSIIGLSESDALAFVPPELLSRLELQWITDEECYDHSDDDGEEEEEEDDTNSLSSSNDEDEAKNKNDDQNTGGRNTKNKLDQSLSSASSSPTKKQPLPPPTVVVTKVGDLEESGNSEKEKNSNDDQDDDGNHLTANNNNNEMFQTNPSPASLMKLSNTEASITTQAAANQSEFVFPSSPATTGNNKHIIDNDDIILVRGTITDLRVFRSLLNLAWVGVADIGRARTLKRKHRMRHQRDDLDIDDDDDGDEPDNRMFERIASISTMRAADETNSFVPATPARDRVGLNPKDIIKSNSNGNLMMMTSTSTDSNNNNNNKNISTLPAHPTSSAGPLTTTISPSIPKKLHRSSAMVYIRHSSGAKYNVKSCSLFHSLDAFQPISPESVNNTHTFVVVASHENPAIGERLESRKFVDQFGCAILSVKPQRSQENIVGRELAWHVLEAGDTLLVRVRPKSAYLWQSALARESFYDILNMNSGAVAKESEKLFQKHYIQLPFLLPACCGLSQRSVTIKGDVVSLVKLPKWYMDWVPIVIFLLFIGLTMAGISVTPVSLVCIILLIWTNIITVRDAVKTADWKVYTGIAFAFAIGKGIKVSGLAAFIGDNAARSGASGFSAVLLMYALTGLVSCVVGNSGTPTVMLPIALRMASIFGISNIATANIVANGCIAGFMTTFGLPANLIISAPGNYTAKHFVLFGTPTFVVYCLASSLFTVIQYDLW